MYIPFEKLDPLSKIWIFPSRQNLSSQLEDIEAILKKFIDGWNAHGTPIKGSFAILDDHFIVLGADERHTPPSGCSIDSSVEVIRSLEEKMGFTLLRRDWVPFVEQGKIKGIALQDLRKAYKAGDWKGESRFYNLSITLKKELESLWIIEASNSWLKRYSIGQGQMA